MPTARKPTPKSEPDLYVDTAKDAAIDVLLRRAFPHGQWFHVSEWLEQQLLAPEVRDEIAAAVERSR